MTPEQVGAVLVFANELDGRHAPNQLKVAAWLDVLRESAPTVNVDFARECVRQHYAVTDDMFTVHSLVKAWADSVKRKRETMMSESHCGKHTCQCSHDRGCYKGWMEGKENAVPCGMCRGELLDVLAVLPEPGLRSQGDFTRIRRRGVHGEG